MKYPTHPILLRVHEASPVSAKGNQIYYNDVFFLYAGGQI